MHKKPFIAVLALGLLLLTSGSVFAIEIGGDAPVKSFGSGQSKGAAGSPVLLESDPAVHIQSGSERTVPGTFCDGRWQGPVTYRIPGYMIGEEYYAVYQDPDESLPFSFGTCGVPSNYTFDVTAINWHVTLRPASVPLGVSYPYTTFIQPTTFSVDPAFPACATPGALPGGIGCAGPVYAVTFPINGLYLLSLPFPVECCVTGPYHAGVYLPVPIDPDQMQLITDDGTFNGGPVPGQLCRTWNEWGAGWQDLNDPAGAFFEVNISLWSEGYTPDDPATHCNPGTCAAEYFYDPAAAPAFGFGLPSGSGGGRDRLGQWTSATGRDTIVAVHIAMNGGAIADKADLLLEIYDGDNGGVGCGGPKPALANVPLYSEVVPEAAWAPGAFFSVTLATPFVWGVLNGGPAERVVVALGVVPGTGTTNGIYANNDDGACGPNDHFIARYPNAPNTDWKYVFEVSGIAPHLFMELDICREVLPAEEEPCLVSGADEWNQYGHDAQRTSASKINVGDPNGVKLAWTSALPQVSAFTNPTIANDWIYISSDARLAAYDLTSGALLHTVAGAPELGGVNRGNATVANIAALGRDVVFVTGGSFASFSAFETDLETSPVIWSNNPGNFNAPFGLVSQARYNASVVVDVAGTDVAFVGVDPNTGAGRLFAFDAATGALYPGWATNPLVLDAALKHTPTVSGGKLYVGTAVGSTLTAGSLYQIDAATGTIDWTYVAATAGEGWAAGVSTEGDFLYGATKDAGNIGHRYKIDKSGALPSTVWSSIQGANFHGTPTIGRSFVYFPLDNPDFGILQVDKALGLVVHNFASASICGANVGQVPQQVTLSCDAYLFAGNRDAQWWLLNAVSGAAEWYRQFPIPGAGVVNGTSLVRHSVTGTEYAVVGCRASFGGASGSVSAYELNTGSRPRLIQCVLDVDISVALNSGPGQPWSEPGALLNIGNDPLTFSGYSVSDPAPSANSIAIGNARDFRNRVSAASRTAYDGVNSYFGTTELTKSQRIAGVSGDMSADGDFSAMEYNRVIVPIEEAAANSGRNSTRSMAAGSSMIRTSAVTINGSGFPYVLAAGGTGDLDWLFDGTGLGRGLDDNDLELDNDDPDFNFDASNNGFLSTAVVHIHYIGGCLRSEDQLDFGANPGSGNENQEDVFSYGALGFQGRATNWVFHTDPIDDETSNYDSGLMLLGDSTAGVDGGAQIRIQIYQNGGDFNHYVGNAAPVSAQCGFDVQTNILLGQKRTGGCPGAPADIFGEIITNSISDTDFAATPGTRLAAIGMDIIQTEVGSYDALYGDFKLIQWNVINRDAAAKGPIYIGSYTDWDVVNNYLNNLGNYSAAANGYYIWDASGAGSGNAYGALDPSHRSTYSGIQPMNPAFRLSIHANAVRQPAGWPNGDLELMWGQAVHEVPFYSVDAGGQGDKSGFMLNAAMNFGPNESIKRYQAYYGVDATSNVDATIAANVLALAKRAARWGGFARGDVNDDGLVDLADVCWIQGGNPLYPGAYSGDVDADGDNDAADEAQLLSFVSGNAGAQPQGAWRF